jgi:hypothetical protein
VASAHERGTPPRPIGGSQPDGRGATLGGMTASYDPNQHIQVIAKPGGLSGAAHGVHILICVFTCGLWLPGYLIFMAAAPNQRFEVIAPYGADPQLVARARLEAEAPGEGTAASSVI